MQDRSPSAREKTVQLQYISREYVPFGLNGRDYYPPIPELGTWRPRTIHDWRAFIKDLRTSRAMEKATAWH